MLAALFLAQILLFNGAPRTPVTCALPDDFDPNSLSTCYAQDYGTFVHNGTDFDVDLAINWQVNILRYTGGTHSSPSQCFKLTLKEWAGTSSTPAIYTGAVLRATSSAAGAKYGVWARPDIDRLQWAYVNGNSPSQIDSTTSCGDITTGTVLCGRLNGTGTSTQVDAWLNCSGTDYTLWGAAACTLTNDPPTPVDSGTYSGIGIDNGGASNETTTVDDFNAWDCP